MVSQEESHELFLSSLHGTTTPPAAFNAQHNSTNSQGHGRAFSSRGTSSRGRGRGSNRHPPHCQLCRTNGHYASSCPSLPSYATQASSTDESLAKAFHAQCHVTTNSPDWYVDSGATDHMTSSCDSLHQSAPYKGKASVLFGNGHTLPIIHKSSSLISNNILLWDVLVIPHLTKKLLSIIQKISFYIIPGKLKYSELQNIFPSMERFTKEWNFRFLLCFEPQFKKQIQNHTPLYQKSTRILILMSIWGSIQATDPYLAWGISENFNMIQVDSNDVPFLNTTPYTIGPLDSSRELSILHGAQSHGVDTKSRNHFDFQSDIGLDPSNMVQHSLHVTSTKNGVKLITCDFEARLQHEITSRFNSLSIRDVDNQFQVCLGLFIQSPNNLSDNLSGVCLANENQCTAKSS
ncbi:zinc finger, CCHC-type, Gag-polypeptide of LTR copia-type [Artemisia annua]|uniref:Zinc finger, CCHC-type, Gag-polypeptide of LTR copia-type n=1 Tax=Artemisia annua TaxID=35608 RepID=A0A2U1N4U3_ARTAN|nr:zinc finger, CCHC-type, Gag-polypeptide of LTR copia-type [Artemisia annua]